MNKSDSITPAAADPARALRPGAFVPWIVAGLFVLAAVVFAMGPGTEVVWQTTRANLNSWRTWTDHHLIAALLIFFAVYAVFASLPLPVLTVMSLLAGCLFGRWLGTGVASLAYTFGVTLAFLAARGLLREPLRARFGDRLRAIERGFRRDGAFYLLSLRLMPAIPFFLINWLMALTPIRTRTYSLVSWVGVLPMTFLYASVGTELAAMQTPADVLSPPVLLSLVALAVAPLLIRYAIRRFGARKEGG